MKDGTTTTACYSFAGCPVRLCTLYPDIHACCMDYRTTDVPRFTVRTTAEDIAFEREKSVREDVLQGIPRRQFSDSYLETLAVYRGIAEKMPFYDRFLFHGSAISVDGTGYLFTAKSGTGKSTHARLWRELLGERAVMVNDDKPLLQVTDRGAVVYGTPWDGKHRLSSNISAPLRAICILERAPVNRIREISKSEALPTLIQQAYRPKNPAALAQTLALLDRLNVRFYRLSCNMEPEAAELSYHTLKGGNP